MRHRPGGVGLRPKHPGVTGAMGPSTSWDSWPTRSREGPWGRRSVHRSAKTASRSRFGAFVYTVAPTSCVGWHERLNRHGVSAAPHRYSDPCGLLGRSGSLSRPLRMPSQATPDRSSQSSLDPGYHGARLVEEAGPLRAPAQRPSVPTVPSWRRDGPPTAGMSHPPMFYARPGAG